MVKQVHQWYLGARGLPCSAMVLRSHSLIHLHHTTPTEEDKTTDTSLEYWFRCCDLDGDEHLHSSELYVSGTWGEMGEWEWGGGERGRAWSAHAEGVSGGYEASARTLLFSSAVAAAASCKPHSTTETGLQPIVCSSCPPSPAHVSINAVLLRGAAAPHGVPEPGVGLLL